MFVFEGFPHTLLSIYSQREKAFQMEPLNRLKKTFELKFELEAESGHARAGKLFTAHGWIRTPQFMVVGTKAVVRCLTVEELLECGVEVVLGNTYHLHLRPGEKQIAHFGGLHKYMRWPKVLLTDSGGFQLHSLAKLIKQSKKGVEFQSHINGDRVFLSPEKSMQIQMDLKSDIIMAFDACLSYPATYDQIRTNMDLTYDWLLRSQKAMTSKNALLFAIVQGGMNADLRRESIQQMTELDLPGYALGGLSVGEPISLMYEMIRTSAPLLPQHKPRYLMGVGKPQDLLHAIDAGMDMFDCILPTKVARHGTLYTWKGKQNIKNKKHRESSSPIDESCGCYVCQNYSLAYLRHLFMIGELLALRLNSYHNIYFYMELLKKVREHILKGSWPSFKKECLSLWTDTDEESL